MKSFLLSGTLAAVLALGAGGFAQRRERSRTRWSRPIRPARCSNSNRAALREPRRDRAAGRARRGGRRSAPASRPTSRARSRISQTSSTTFRRRSTCRCWCSTTARPRPRSSRRATWSPPAAPISRTSSRQVLFNAVQAYVDVLRDQEFVRLASNDVGRLNETLDATRNRFDVGEVTRTDVSQSEARLAESRSTLAGAPRASSRSRARPTWRRSARCRATSSRRRRCRRCRSRSTRRRRSASSATR